MNLAGPPIQAGLRVTGGWHRCKAKRGASLRTYSQGCEGCSLADDSTPSHPLSPRRASLPGAGPASLRTTLTVVGAVVSVADAEVAPAILHAVPAIRALRVHVARCGGDFCKHTASAGLHQPAAGHPAACLATNGDLLTLQGLMRWEGPSVHHATDRANGKGQPRCPASFGAGAHEGCGSPPTQGNRAGARGWQRHSLKGSDRDGCVASSPGDNISRLKFSASPRYRARLRLGQSLSLLPHSLPGSSIPEREQTQQARSFHLPNSQRRPKNPGGHWQTVMFPSRQLPPLRHSQPSESSAKRREWSFPGPLLLAGLGQPSSFARCHARGGGAQVGGSHECPQTPRHGLLQLDRPTVQSRALSRAAASPSQGCEGSTKDVTTPQRDPRYSLSRQSCPV